MSNNPEYFNFFLKHPSVLFDSYQSLSDKEKKDIVMAILPSNTQEIPNNVIRDIFTTFVKKYPYEILNIYDNYKEQPWAKDIAYRAITLMDKTKIKELDQSTLPNYITEMIKKKIEIEEEVATFYNNTDVWLAEKVDLSDLLEQEGGVIHILLKLSQH